MPTPLPFETHTRVILCWPGDDAVEVTSTGEVVRVPPRHEVFQTGRWRAAELNGEPLPGTVEIEDMFGVSRDGGRVKTFDAQQFAQLVYDNNQALLDRGFAIVQNASQVPAAQEAGRPKWEEHLAVADEEEIRTEMARRARWESQGQPAPPPSSPKSLAAAVKRQEERQKGLLRSGISDDALRRALGQPVQAAPPQPEPPAPQPPVPVSPEPAAGAPELLVDEAESLNLYLKRDELAGLLRQDPSVIAAVRRRVAEAKSEKASEAVAS